MELKLIMGYINRYRHQIQRHRTLTTTETKAYSLRLGRHLFEKLNKHVTLLKLIEGKRKTKQEWIAEAIREKLEREPDPEHCASYTPKVITIRLDEDTDRSLESKVDMLKRMHGNFSKRQLLVEAIQEKLENEEGPSRDALARIASPQN